jgi:L-ascorbate 6-phosphate lactonase
MLNQIGSNGVQESASVTVNWLLQAGFLFDFPTGERIAIDPYLSDMVGRRWGAYRSAPPPISADELRADFIIFTHWHEDHFDEDSLAGFATHRSTQFVGPISCVKRMLGRGMDPQRVHELSPDMTMPLGNVRAFSTPARHDLAGLEAPDAIGVLLQSNSASIYHSGDTEYDARIHRHLSADPPTASLICINGTGGNMNVREAALLAVQVGSSTVVPMHFGLWSDQDYGSGATLDPSVFGSTYESLGGVGRVVIPQVGIPISIG